MSAIRPAQQEQTDIQIAIPKIWCASTRKWVKEPSENLLWCPIVEANARGMTWERLTSSPSP